MSLSRSYGNSGGGSVHDDVYDNPIGIFVSSQNLSPCEVCKTTGNEKLYVYVIKSHTPNVSG